MGTTKHSPSPWKAHVRSKKVTSIIADNGYHVANVCTLVASAEQDAGNIELMKAAPELLASLRELWEYTPDLPDEPLSLYHKGLQRAIKKAKELLDRLA